MKSPAEINTLLAHCTGTESYHRVCPSLNLVVTDGVKLLCDSAECYWLIDLIASHQRRALKDPALRDMQFWTLKVDLQNKTAVATCERDKKDVVITQKIPYTSFPLSEIKIWVAPANEKLWVAMLPSEY